MTQLSLFEDGGDTEIPLHEFFEAYFECRRNKRTTCNALAFEIEYEQRLLELHKEINDRSYRIGRSVAFVVHKPVLREIFAADFHDRIVHHLLIRKLNPLFEREFIHDSYACRVGRGTLFGIRRIDRFIRQCSQNYTLDCYILKLDIEAFFMHIDRQVLYRRLEKFIRENYSGDDKDTVLWLTEQIIFNDPTQSCIIKGDRCDWSDLPPHKSLFNASSGCGLPIGNLTSQIFANFYMTEFDHWMKHALGVRYYGRYVDDFVIIHTDRRYLALLIPKITEYLQSQLGLTLHPKKIYLQYCSHGVQYLGAVIKPYRIYIASRTLNNFREAIYCQNKVLCNEHSSPTAAEFDCFLSTVNSYLGFMKHNKSYRCRSVVVSKLSPLWWSQVATVRQCTKFVKSKLNPPLF